MFNTISSPSEFLASTNLLEEEGVRVGGSFLGSLSEPLSKGMTAREGARVGEGGGSSMSESLRSAGIRGAALALALVLGGPMIALPI
jgi:hypothetical protein